MLGPYSHIRGHLPTVGQGIPGMHVPSSHISGQRCASSAIAIPSLMRPNSWSAMVNEGWPVVTRASALLRVAAWSCGI